MSAKSGKGLGFSQIGGLSKSGRVAQVYAGLHREREAKSRDFTISD
jgi:hypothetical protein